MELKEGYKQTNTGIFPEDWGLHTIGDSMRLVNGRAFKPEDWGDQGLPIIRIQNLNDPTSDFNHWAGPVENRHIIEPGDLVFAWSGTKGTSFGARVWQGPTGVLNQHIFKVLPDTRKLTRSYAFHILRQVQEDIEKQAHGFKASFVHVKKSDLVGVQLPLPPTNIEQETIAEALSDADALIESLEQLIAKKRQIKQGAAQELLTGKRRLPGFEAEAQFKQSEIGEIPSDWSVSTIGDLSICYSGGTPNTANPSFYGGNIPWITSGDLNLTRIKDVEGRITAEGLAQSSAKIVKPGTVLIALYGATAGIAAITEIRAAINQAVLAIVSNLVHAEYLFQLLRYRKDLYVATYTQGGQPNLSGDLVKAFLVAIPRTREEQEYIAGVLIEMD